MAELRQVLATLTGKEMVVAERAELPDMRSLHPRGHERFSEADLSARWQAGVHHNALLATIREGLSAPADEEWCAIHSRRRGKSGSYRGNSQAQAGLLRFRPFRLRRLFEGLGGGRHLHLRAVPKQIRIGWVIAHKSDWSLRVPENCEVDLNADMW
jgi:hypothetical protein